MIKCVAIYPHQIDETYIEKVNETISLAFKHEFNEIFTTIHLPEYSLDQQLSCLEIIAEQTKKYDMDLVVDIGGKYINELLDDDNKINKIKQYNIDYIRLDYGYDINQVKSLYMLLNIKGFVINASMYDRNKLAKIIESFKQIDNNIKIRACHNFYVRKESGLDDVFASRQDSYFEEYDIPVYYFIPTHSNPRGPIYEGLCTIERHRYMSIKDIIVDLYKKHNLKAFIMADEWLSENEFNEIETITNKLENKDNNIQVEFFDGVSEQEKEIVLGKHIFRYDSPSECLRSLSSRQMAEFASSIEKNNTIPRKTGYITIDNELYKRYSGEMQVILKDMDEDERINVVGRIVNEDDLYKLLHYKDNVEYNFIV